MESMYDMLQETLLKINFIPTRTRCHWMFNVRRLFYRHGLRARGGPGDQGHLPSD